MKIGIIDADLIYKKEHKFPNLACLKISGYHKKLGHDVNLISYEDINPNSLFFQKFDKVYISKVFTDTKVPENILNLPFVEYGGTGFFYDKAPDLPYEIEHSFPDYNLYDKWIEEKVCNGKKRNYFKYYIDYSIGFITKGCFRQCEFCVNRNKKKVELHSPINEFLDKKRPFIMLLDDNVTGSDQYLKIIENLNNTGKQFVFKQGMDFRLMTKKRMKILWNSNYLSTAKDGKCKGARVFHFAFDNIKDYNIIEKRLKEYYYNKPYSFKVFFYVLVGYDRNNEYNNVFFKQDINNLIKRIELLFKYNAYPYIMLHENYKLNPEKEIIRQIARTCNTPMFITNKTIKKAVIQNKKYKLLKYLELNHKQFLNIQFNSKLYKTKKRKILKNDKK